MQTQSLSEKFNEIDYFTQRQIINEFPSIFPECHNIKEADYSPVIEQDGVKWDNVGIMLFFALGIVSFLAKVL